VDKENNGSVSSVSKRGGKKERFDQEGGPSTWELEEGVSELKQEVETTQSLTSAEL